MRFLMIFISLCALIGPVPSAAAESPEISDLSVYLDHALNNHPVLATAKAQAKVAGYHAQSAGALPDLKLGWGEMLVPVETRVGPQQRVFSVSQSIPWFGTLGRKSDAARSQSDLAAWALVQKQWEVAAGVQLAWTDLIAWRQEIIVVKEHQILARQQEVTAEAHFSSGSGSFAHALRAQMAVVKVDQRLDLLKKRESVLAANLNSAAGYPVHQPLPDLTAMTAMEVRYSEVSYQVLADQMLRQNPQLKALVARKDRFGHEADLAALGGKPNFTIGLDYIMTGQAAMAGVEDTGKDPVIARLGLSVPLWSGKVEVKQSEQNMKVAEASHQVVSLQLELERLLKERIYQWEEARDILLLNRDELLPRARSIHESENARYESGTGDFADIITAREELLDLELMVVKNAAQWIKADIGLELLLGNFAVTGHESEHGNEQENE